jgi:uncharacterized cupredoxin-like copper-binding protein
MTILQRFKRSIAWAIAFIFCASLSCARPVLASDRSPIPEVTVSLGNAAGELKFFPNEFKFVAGQPYKLLLDNPSPQKHYFTAKDFADASWTRKVDAGNVEIKGAIRELELRPQSQAQWVFVPLKPGTYPLRCTIPGHAEAGMTGTIQITENR